MKNVLIVVSCGKIAMFNCNLKCYDVNSGSLCCWINNFIWCKYDLIQNSPTIKKKIQLGDYSGVADWEWAKVLK